MEKDLKLLKTLYEVLFDIQQAYGIISRELEDIDNARKKLIELIDKLNN